MKKFFSLFVIGGLILVALAVFFINHQSELQKKEFQKELGDVKRKFGESQAPLRSSGEPAEYARDQNELLRRYKSEIERLGKKNKDLLDVEAERRRFAEADEKKPLGPDQKKLREEYFEITKAAYDKLMSGAYAPALTGFSNGVRFDLLALKRVTTNDNEEMLRADFIAWGFPAEINYGDINMAVWVTKPSTAKKPKKPEEKVEEIKYKFDASQARPIINVSNPDRWVPAFPPTTAVGYYYLQLLPRDSEKLDLAFHFQMTTDSGRIVPVDFAFEKLTVTEPMLLPVGAKFEAQEKEASDAERQGRREDEDLPEAKTKGATR